MRVLSVTLEVHLLVQRVVDREIVNLLSTLVLGPGGCRDRVSTLGLGPRGVEWGSPGGAKTSKAATFGTDTISVDTVVV